MTMRIAEFTVIAEPSSSVQQNPLATIKIVCSIENGDITRHWITNNHNANIKSSKKTSCFA